MKCPNCNNELISIVNGRDLIAKCSNCDYELFSTNDIAYDFDETKYTISISKNNETSIDNIKYISKLLGENFINAKKSLIERKLVFTGYAIQIIPIRNQLETHNIMYTIYPNFKY